MKFKENKPLAPYTTFKIGGPAKWFCIVENQFDALEAFEFAQKNDLKVFVLGGGSNILVSDKGFNGLVIKVVNKGIEIITPVVPSRANPNASEDESRDPSARRMHSSVGMTGKGEDKNQILLKVASGEVWDEVAKFAVTNGWWGIENLSHIPGSTGAIAVQNVGAYGQEASQVVDSVTVFSKETHSIQSFKNSQCGFGYRQSIFNSVDKGKYIIFDITLRLSKLAHPNLEYRDLKIKFAGKNPALSEVRQAVIEVRNKKFPFPTKAKNGNAGSFFKNPVLDSVQYEKLSNKIGAVFGRNMVLELEKKKFTDDGQIKIPAAFLIDLCGLKNLSFGGAKINHSQPLVIINATGKATAQDVLALANKVKQEVRSKTGMELLYEPELVGFTDQ